MMCFSLIASLQWVHSDITLRKNCEILASGIGVCTAHTPSDVEVASFILFTEGKQYEASVHGVGGFISAQQRGTYLTHTTTWRNHGINSLVHYEQAFAGNAIADTHSNF